MKDPKYPHDLSIIQQSDNNSSPQEKEIEGWIMSTSKSFCGATAALMSADGKFGEKKMEASLLDALETAKESAKERLLIVEEDPNETIKNLAKAKKEYSERMSKIEKYEEAIIGKECGDVTMAELLSHRSGLEQKSFFTTTTPKFENDNLGLFNSDLVPYDSSKKGKIFSYNNPGFMLAADIMALASDSGDYELEIENRITKPLGMNHTKSVYKSEEAKSNPCDIISINGVVSEDWSEKGTEDSRRNSLYATQTGKAPIAAGGLCSSISDMEIYSKALSEMICGIPNALTGNNQDKAKEIHESYLDAYHLGDNCTIVGKPSPDVTYCANHYSLGIFIGAVDDKEEQIASRENRDKRLFFKHDGNMPGYDSKMKIVMQDVSFDDFESGKAAELPSLSPTTTLLIAKWDPLVRDSLLTLVSHDYAKEMDGYFSSKAEENDAHLNDGSRKYWQHIAVVRNKPVSPGWEADLIQEGKLPSNFSAYHDEVRAAYEPAKAVLNSYITANYIKDGVINSEKIVEDFKTAEDFRKVEMIIEPHLQEAREKVQEIFVRADHARMMESGPKVPSGSSKAVEATHLADDKIIDVKKGSDDKSWVDEVADGKKSSRGNSDEMMM